MDFSEALKVVKAGGRVSRKGWNGKGMFIFFVDEGISVASRAPVISAMAQDQEITLGSHIDLKDAQGKVVPWQPSQTDLLAEDWGIVET